MYPFLVQFLVIMYPFLLILVIMYPLLIFSLLFFLYCTLVCSFFDFVCDGLNLMVDKNVGFYELGFWSGCFIIIIFLF